MADSASALGTNAAGLNAQAAEVGDSDEAHRPGRRGPVGAGGPGLGSITDMAQALQRTSLSAVESTAVASRHLPPRRRGPAARPREGACVFSRLRPPATRSSFGEKAGGEISEIVDAITQVAQQTNLLALNATIEGRLAGVSTRLRGGGRRGALSAESAGRSPRPSPGWP